MALRALSCFAFSKKVRNTLLGIMFICLSPDSEAGEIGLEVARKTAESWCVIENELVADRPLPLKLERIEGWMVKGRVVAYVAHLQPNGFLLIPRSDLAAPIKYVSLQGSFDDAVEHPFIAEIGNDLFSLLDASNHMAGLKRGPRDRNRSLWNRFLRSDKTVSLDVAVEPLLSTTWNQQYPYNIETPVTLNGETTPTGCTATALAQVMNYWQHPQQGYGRHTSINHPVLADFMHHYDWHLMRDSYSEASSPQEQAAVARLMADVGVGIDTSYNTNGSGSSLSRARNALCRFFGYSCYSRNVWSEDYESPDGWNGLLQQQLDNGWPILVGVGQGFRGHAVVFDGYRTVDGVVQFHVNLGWGGFADGYYTADAVYDFDGPPSALIDIYPGDSGETGSLSGTVYDLAGSPVAFVNIQAKTASERPLGRMSGSSWSREDGSFLIEGLKPDTYQVFFETIDADGLYCNQWYDNPVVVSEDERVEHVEVALAPTQLVGSLGGQARLHYGSVWFSDGDHKEIIPPRMQIRSDGSFFSDYQIPAGTYKLWFEARSFRDFFSSSSNWISGKAAFAEAQQINIGEQSRVHAEIINVSNMEWIFGKVLDQDGAGIPSVAVRYYDLSGYHVLRQGFNEPQQTYSDGSFQGYLPVGQYKILFDPAENTELGYQWYGGGATFEDAEIVDINERWADLEDVRLESVAEPCSPALVVTHPLNQVIVEGESVHLSVAAQGSEPITYQWFQGEKDDRSSMVGGSESFTSSPLFHSTRFWAEARNSCGWSISGVAEVYLCPGSADTTDTDGDWIPDSCDLCPGSDDRNDGDGDGIPNGCDSCPEFDDRVDGDGDGVPDGCDLCPGSDDMLDNDDDGVPDGCDLCPTSDDSIDRNNNGIPDGCEPRWASGRH